VGSSHYMQFRGAAGNESEAIDVMKAVQMEELS
jgi:hypothetical protein